jgi:putative DNA primase/helicase
MKLSDEARPKSVGSTAPSNVTPIGIAPGQDLSYLRAELCTETRAADIFCQMFGSRVHYVPGWGWLLWDGRRWARDDSGRILELASAVAEWYRDKAVEFDRERRPAELRDWLLAFARKIQGTRAMRDFLEQAKPALSALPETFDAFPLLLNFANGTLNIESMREGHEWNLSPQCQADRLTKIIPRDYNPTAKAPTWDAFLCRVFQDMELRFFMRRAVGYSITGLTREQCFFIAHGTGANGKSTFLNVLQKVIGPDYAMQADPASFLADRGDGVRNDIAAMRGVRLLSAIETGDNRRLDEALVKAVTGGDAIRCRFLYQESFQFTPAFKLWLATNHRPRVLGTDHAIWRRVRLIPFEVQIPESEQDKNLETKLLREAEGILAWAVEGAFEYLRGGLREPAEVKDATAQYRADEDVIGDWLQTSCILQPHAMGSASELHKSFAEETGSGVSQTAFGKRLIERGFERVTINGKRFYKGVGLAKW